MLGICLNLILIIFAAFSIAAGITFFKNEPDSGYIRIYTLLFAIANALTSAGYALMGFATNINYAFIPRLIGLFGIDAFLIFEFAYLTDELKLSMSRKGFFTGFYILFLIFDLIVFGRPSTLKYIRYDVYNSYITVNNASHIFHYLYVTAVAIGLIALAIKWYRSRKSKRDRQFITEIALANFTILIAAVPDMFKLHFASRFPAFGYCTALTIVFFSWCLAVKHHIVYTPTVNHASKDIFNSIQVPVMIFDLEGKLCLFNPFAAKKISLVQGEKPGLRDIFTLTDVEELRILARAKTDSEWKIETKIKSTDENCTVSFVINYDTSAEPFCIIGTLIRIESAKAELKE